MNATFFVFTGIISAIIGGSVTAYFYSVRDLNARNGAFIGALLGAFSGPILLLPFWVYLLTGATRTVEPQPLYIGQQVGAGGPHMDYGTRPDESPSPFGTDLIDDE